MRFPSPSSAVEGNASVLRASRPGTPTALPRLHLLYLLLLLLYPLLELVTHRLAAESTHREELPGHQPRRLRRGRLPIAAADDVEV